jgi:hypothetical protein
MQTPPDYLLKRAAKCMKSYLRRNKQGSYTCRLLIAVDGTACKSRRVEFGLATHNEQTACMRAAFIVRCFRAAGVRVTSKCLAGEVPPDMLKTEN